MKKTYWAHMRLARENEADQSVRKIEGMDPEMIGQTVEEHLRGTAALSSKFAGAFGEEKLGELVGLVHDLGKCTDGFQNRLLRGGPKVDHSTAGAVVCATYKQFGAAACVAGHHGGLQDFGNSKADQPGTSTLYGRLKKGIAEKYVESCGDSGIELPSNIPEPKRWPESLKEMETFWIRMLYSCLVDADYLDTEQFMDGDRGRGGYDSIGELLERLEKNLKKWDNPKTELNRLRCEILDQCRKAGAWDRGIYTLTVPTGGGKTMASLLFALWHAKKHGMSRIIYVIPYTSIIDQNAEKFREILGEGNVLEHHSGVQFDLSEEAGPEEIRKALAVENWDMPVVVTTAVQFFESLYSNRSSKCRKLHNLANSVIIFDEAQMLPVSHLKPCTAAMASLAEQFRSTVVLCTATQPSLNDLFQKYAPSCRIRELCPQIRTEFDRFRRVTFRNIGVLKDEELAEQLQDHKQVLCIVNSRKAAQSIFSLLPEEGRFHLSTLMIPAARQKILAEIKRRLSEGKICRVISTSLIEAGVDIDFPSVYREMTGLDSILQAAGRCNREGKRSLEESVVTIFERTISPPILFQKTVEAAKEALAGDRDPGVPETMDRYFRSIRSLSEKELDKDKVMEKFRKGHEGSWFPFRYVAEHFHLLDSNTKTIYIPWDEGAELIEQLRAGDCSRNLFRKLGRYAVSVYEPHYKKLNEAGVLQTANELPILDADSAILTKLPLYSETMGLTLEPETGNAEFI